MSKNAANAGGKKSGKMKKMLMVGVGGTALVAAGIGGGIYFSGALNAGHAEENHNPKLVLRSEGDAAAHAPEGESKEPVLKVGTVSVANDRVKIDPRKYEATYYTLDQAFTSNLANGDGFVQVGLSLATYYDGKVITNIQRQMVPVRSAILMVLSEQDAAVLSTPQGKAALQRKMTGAINDVLRQKEGFGGVENVYFTNLVIQ